VCRHASGGTFATTVAISVATTCLIIQAGWSLSVYFGYLFPAVAFYVGVSNGVSAFITTDVVNLAGTAPLWLFFGGPADFLQAGGLPLGKIATVAGTAANFGFSLAVNAFILSVIVAAFAVWWMQAHGAGQEEIRSGRSTGRFQRWHSRRVWKWPMLCLALALIISGAGSSLQKQIVLPFSADQVTQLPGEHTLVMRLRISREASRKILDLLSRDPELEGNIFLRASGLVASSLIVGDEQVDMVQNQTYSSPLLWRFDTAAFRRALTVGSDRLVFSATLRDGVLGGWQSSSPGTREVTPRLVTDDRDYWPSLELRLIDRLRNTTVLLGY